VPILWQFHKIHHSDDRMNTSTWAARSFPAGKLACVFLGIHAGLDHRSPPSRGR
jgi:sterol desaturase/sphingolipid hydroxylase (fatty acid hydroxylase superfamily)